MRHFALLDYSWKLLIFGLFACFVACFCARTHLERCQRTRRLNYCVHSTATASDLRGAYVRFCSTYISENRDGGRLQRQVAPCSGDILNTDVNKSDERITVGLLNVQSINHRSMAVSDTISARHLHVIVLTEIWHQQSTDLSLRRAAPPGYSISWMLPDHRLTSGVRVALRCFTATDSLPSRSHLT